MDATQPQQNGRTLAQIEGDLLKAEASFADADSRHKAAERDRRAAVETINRHQVEFDQAIAQLRQRSTPGSRWRLEIEKPEDALILQPEDITEDLGAANRPRLQSVSDDFDRLKSYVQSAGSERRR